MTPVVRILLVLNIGIFVLQNTAPWITEVFEFYPPFAMFRPWTAVTYMFVHAPGLMHIGFNMIALVFFGPRVEDRIGSKRFTVLYVLSGITGAFLSMIFSPTSPIIGASAGVFGVMLAFAHFWPDAPLLIWGIFPVPARTMIIFTTIISIWSGFNGGGNIAHFAHLGGYAGAWLYMRWLDRAKGAFKRKASTAPPVVNRQLEAWRSIDLSKVHEVNREEVRRLLEKVQMQGLGALTGQERVFLSGFLPADHTSPKPST
jgi:membrane associated rhomboid family serine protease